PDQGRAAPDLVVGEAAERVAAAGGPGQDGLLVRRRGRGRDVLGQRRGPDVVNPGGGGRGGGAARACRGGGRGPLGRGAAVGAAAVSVWLVPTIGVELSLLEPR